MGSEYTLKVGLGGFAEGLDKPHPTPSKKKKVNFSLVSDDMLAIIYVSVSLCIFFFSPADCFMISLLLFFSSLTLK